MIYGGWAMIGIVVVDDDRYMLETARQVLGGIAGSYEDVRQLLTPLKNVSSEKRQPAEKEGKRAHCL